MPSSARFRRFAGVTAVLCLCVIFAQRALASYHTFVIDSLYSNADGSVQYVVLRESQGANGENLLSGHTLVSTHAGASKTFTFPNDLPSSATAGKRVLIATEGFAAISTISPDYLIPDRFLATDGGSVDYAGVDSVTYAALPVDGTNALARDGTTVANVATNFAGRTFTVPTGSITVVEFYNADLDHYFISPLAPDIDALDSGRIGGWSRTGYTFDASPTAAGASASPVCRFYIPPEHGDSHFFSASPSECAAVLQKIGNDPNYSGYVHETPNAFYIAVPEAATGACPPSAVSDPVFNPSSVFRLWNARADSNHRYATDPSVRAQMIARGYVSEGYGPQGVAMCTLNAKIGDSRVRVTGVSPLVPGCDGAPVTGTLFTGAEVEPMIAVNPLDADNLVGVWQQDRWSDGGAAGLRSAASFDGGRSWAISQAPFSRCTGGTAANGGDYARVSDPWVTIAPDGTAFQIALAFNGDTFASGSINAVLVSRSADGGRTWSNPATLIQDGSGAFNDKESITADRYRAGFAYATWDRLVPSGSGPSYFTRTTNNGASWEAARPIFDPGARSQTLNNQVVALPPAAPGGPNTIVTFFTQIDLSSNDAMTQRLALVRSQDNGGTWSAPIYIANIQAVGTHDPELGTELRDGASLGSFASGPNGELAAVWQDARFSSGARDGVAFVRSNDGGLTWSAPVQVNGVPAVQALLPAITIRDDGTFAVLYYDMRNNTADASLLIDAWLATSVDGVIWKELHVGGPFDMQNAPIAEGGRFIGDYQGIAAGGNALFPFFVMANVGPANRTDVFASAVRSIPSYLLTSAAKSYRVVGAPDSALDAQARGRVSDRVKRTQQWRRIGSGGQNGTSPVN